MATYYYIETQDAFIISKLKKIINQEYTKAIKIKTKGVFPDDAYMRRFCESLRITLAATPHATSMDYPMLGSGWETIELQHLPDVKKKVEKTKTP